jgi:hypothetical protein
VDGGLLVAASDYNYGNYDFFQYFNLFTEIIASLIDV